MRTSCCALASSRPRKELSPDAGSDACCKAGVSARELVRQRGGARHAGRGKGFERRRGALIGAERFAPPRVRPDTARRVRPRRATPRRRRSTAPRDHRQSRSRAPCRRQASSPRFRAPRCGPPARRGRCAARSSARRSWLHRPRSRRSWPARARFAPPRRCHRARRLSAASESPSDFVAASAAASGRPAPGQAVAADGCLLGRNGAFDFVEPRRDVGDRRVVRRLRAGRSRQQAAAAA